MTLCSAVKDHYYLLKSFTSVLGRNYGIMLYILSNGLMLNNRIAAPNTSLALKYNHILALALASSGSPLTTTVSHALEIAWLSLKANVTTPLGSCVLSATLITSGYVPSKKAISRALGEVVRVSMSISEGEGSGRRLGFLRSIEERRTWAYWRYGPVSPSNESIRSQLKS